MCIKTMKFIYIIKINWFLKKSTLKKMMNKAFQFIHCNFIYLHFERHFFGLNTAKKKKDLLAREDAINHLKI